MKYLPQNPHHGGVFCVVRICSFLSPQSSQNREDVAKPEIIMHLFAQLFFTEFVEYKKFPSQLNVVFEPARG